MSHFRGGGREGRPRPSRTCLTFGQIFQLLGIFSSCVCFVFHFRFNKFLFDIPGVESWWDDLKLYAQEHKNIGQWQEFNRDKDFRVILSDFLFSPDGVKHHSNFQWNGKLECNLPAPDIRVNFQSQLSFKIYHACSERQKDIKSDRQTKGQKSR